MAATESWFSKILDAVAEHYGFRTDVPVRDLSDEARRIILYGNRGERVDVKYRARNGNIHTFKTTFEGIIPNLTRRHRETGSESMRTDFERYMTNKPCPTCNGMRLKPESRRRDGRRQEHHRDDAAIGDRCAGLVRRAAEAPDRAREPRSPARCSRRSARGSASWSTSASTT